MMSEDAIADAVCDFYTKSYDGTMTQIEKVIDKFPETIAGDEAKLDFVKKIIHFTLSNVAQQLEANDEEDLSPSIRYYVYDDGEDHKIVSGDALPIREWLNDLSGDNSLLGRFATIGIPTASVNDLLAED